MATNPVSTYPLATGEIAAARLALIECVCGPLGREVMRSLGVLPSMLASAKLENIDVQTFQPAYLRGEEKRLWEYTFMEASPTMVAAGYVSAIELAQLAREFGIAAEDERVMVVHPLYAVSSGQRPRSDPR